VESWFSSRLIRWYQANKRDLPWRKSNNIYHIWLSEIILQQTQVQQGLPYFLRFIDAFPTVNDLANASEDAVLKLWQGLGYYSRARNLHTAAKTICALHQGVFPAAYKDLKTLKGVGDYTAAAIASIGFNEPVAVVDGNVYRVLSRVFDISTPIDSAKGKKEFSLLAQSLIHRQQPGQYNQAIMEFGALYCKPVNPDCKACVLRDKCLANAHQQVALRPQKSKKTKSKVVHFNYVLVLDKNNQCLIYKRPKGSIWEGLYEFILCESDAPLTPDAVLSALSKTYPFLKKKATILANTTYQHLLTHRTIRAQFVVVQINNLLPAHLKPTPFHQVTHLPVSRLTDKFLKEYQPSKS